MATSDSLATTIERLQSLLQLPPSQLQKRAYRQLVEEELRQTEVELFHLLNKHGVKTALELDQWFQEGKIEEANAWEEFFEIDALEYKRNQLRDIFVELE